MPSPTICTKVALAIAAMIAPFETLLKAFRIRDRKVAVMAQIVHDADLTDQKFGRAEGLGIDEVLKGWGRMGLPDREILERGTQLAQGLYSSLP